MAKVTGTVKSGGGDFTPFVSLDPGTYDAIVFAYIETGLHKGTVQFKDKETGELLPPSINPRAILYYEVPSVKKEDGSSYTIGQTIFNVSYNEKSNFYKLLKDLEVPIDSDGDSVSFDTDDLIGIKVSIKVEQTVKGTGDDEKAISYVTSARKLDDRLVEIAGDSLVNTIEPFYFIYNNPDIEVFKNKLTPYVRNTVISALNSGDLSDEFHAFHILEQEKFEATKKKKFKNDDSVI